MEQALEALLKPGAPILPRFLLDFNLLKGFIWYVSILFVVSVGLRIRFYHSIYSVARYVARSCPNVFSLVHEHWVLCVRNRFLWLLGTYTVIVSAYMFMSRIVWPQASVSAVELATWSPAVLFLHLVLIGTMISIDLALLVQTSVIDEKKIVEDLKFAEHWLGGRVNVVLGQLLGKWNPIKNYADSLTAQTMLWSNIVFRGSMHSMILQTTLRVMVGTALFVSHGILRNT